MDRRSFNIKNIKYQSVKFAAAFSGAVFLLGGLAFVQPLSLGDNSYADSKNTAISLRIGESIMLPEVSTDSIEMELDPTAADGDFKTGSVTVGVSTNRTAGYTLTASVEGDETALTNAEYNDYEIAALGGKTAAATFADLDDSDSMNKWGYATDNNGDGDGQTEAGYYYAMPDVDNPTTLKITDGPAATSNTEVTFATKGKDLASGKYENTVVFTAVGNLEPTPTMQNFTAEQCDALTEWGSDGSEGDTISLADSRDSNEYQIRKLADGHCWMTQNLRLTTDTLSANGHSSTLTAADTDINGSTPNFVMPNNVPWSASDATVGKLTKGAADASKLPVGSSSGSKSSGAEATARGAYYSWCTATADCTADPGIGIGQPSSICPKGWRLSNPNKGSSTNDNEYYKLFNDSTDGYGSNVTNFNQAFNAYYIDGTSYYFAGYWHAGSSYQYVGTAGTVGFWWSNTSDPSSDVGAANLRVDARSVDPTGDGHRYCGNSVRCVLSDE